MMRQTDERWRDFELSRWLQRHPEQRESHWWMNGDDIPF